MVMEFHYGTFIHTHTCLPNTYIYANVHTYIGTHTETNTCLPNPNIWKSISIK